MSAALQAAQAYVARGWNPLPLPFKAKKPTDNGWQKRVIREPTCPDISTARRRMSESFSAPRRAA